MNVERFRPSTEPEAVLAYLGDTIRLLETAFRAGCIRASDHFTKLRWTYDASLFAFEVRKDVLETLRSAGQDAEFADSESELSVQGLALCGLLLKTPLVHLRIRKSKDGEIPRADGKLEDFYQRNLFASLEEADDLLPLNLMLLWGMDRKNELRQFWLGCPKAKGTDWYWRKSIVLGALDRVVVDEEYLKAFEAANSDVPMSRRLEDDAKERLTGTDSQAGK